MYQINNEKFGLFITMIRKEKNLTQKQLGDSLFVTDKTVSKWERGLSIPNVALLIPLAKVLDVSVTELLRGERMTSENLNKNEVEELTIASLDLSLQNTLSQHKKFWIILFFITCLIVFVEVTLLFRVGLTFNQMKDNILLVCGMMLIFGGVFSCFVKEVLPSYFDQNKINYLSQGFFRMHLPGLSFNNSNWPYICRLMKIMTLACAILYPLICLIIYSLHGYFVWLTIQKPLIIFILIGMIVVTYYIGKKHE